MPTVWHLGLKHRRGSIFLPTLVLVAVMTLLGVALFKLATIDAALSAQDTAQNQLLYCANAALGRALIDSTYPNGWRTQINAWIQSDPANTRTTHAPLSAQVGTPGGLTCSNAVTFIDDTTVTPSRWLVQAKASTPNGTARTVQIQLLSPASESWNDGSKACYNNSNSQSGCTAGTPYYSHTSFDGTRWNVGYYITNSGTFPAALSCTASGPSCPNGTSTVNGVAGLPGPGIPLPYLGGNGAQVRDAFFQAGSGGTQAITFQWGHSNFVGSVPGLPSGEQYDTFGWFETNSSGTTIGTLHPLFTANTSIQPGATTGQNSVPAFTPTAYYGFYLTNGRGTFTTLSSLGSLSSSPPTGDAWPNSPIGPGQGNTLTLGPPYCSSEAWQPAGVYNANTLCSNPFQHFAIFQQNPNTYWIGVKDLYNWGMGSGAPSNCSSLCTPGGTCSNPKCYNRGNVDQDYKNMILKLVVSNNTKVWACSPSSPCNSAANPPVQLPATWGNTPPFTTAWPDSRTWKDWQECLPSCS